MIDIEKVIAEAKDISARWHSQNGLTVGPGKAWVDYVDDLLAAIEQSQKRVAELEGKAKLAEWARHDPGCNYIDNAAYGCRCGLLEAQEALTRIDG